MSSQPDLQEIPESPARVLLVGGTDPSGAAGLVRDIETLSAAGVIVSAAVTAVTVQTSRGVSDVVTLPASVVGAQLDAVWEEVGVDAVKTGMLASQDIVHALADRMNQWGSRVRLVIDPVAAASSGRSLLGREGLEVLRERLLPQCALVTPNLPEAELLTGLTVRSQSEMELAADYLLAQGAPAVLIKGGHLLEWEPEREEVPDLLRTVDGDGLWISRRRQPGPSFRGTGCTLASAIAAGIALGKTLRDAVQEARAVLERAQESAPLLGGITRRLGASPLV